MSAPLKTEYDIIFAGGGAAACVAAGRLAKADPSLKILVLEAGPHTQGLQAHTQPARYLSHLAPTSKTVTFNVSKPSEELLGRSLVIPSGRCVGGGSSVNFAMYTRAAASDYDDWETIYGNAGWGSKYLIPLLKKTETYQVKPDEPTHGYNGPLKISYGGAYTNVAKQYLQMVSKYDKERQSTEDVNGMFSCNAYGRWQKWIDAETGKRSDAPHHFIYNQEGNKNLQVLEQQRVKRVIFENKRAVGVEYVNDIVLSPNADQTVRTARASRLVVVSAGALGSPAILERSGIGSKNVLERIGVKQIVDLPGVGENYQDHNVHFVPYVAADDAETLDAIFRGDEDEIRKASEVWTNEGKGLLAHNGLDAGIKLRPNAGDLKELGTEFESRWQSYFANAPDKPVIFAGIASAYVGDSSVVTRRKYFSMVYFTEYPISLGKTHVNSTDPHAPLDLECGYLRDPADLAVLRWGYKITREWSRRIGAFRGEYAPGHPQFPENSAATGKETNGPVDISAPDITYTAEDDKAIDTFTRTYVSTAWHSLGTCAMKPREKGGVVDQRLNVYGVEGLKVADMSIAPANVGANTYSTALVIGEKAALLIGEDLGINGV